MSQRSVPQQTIFVEREGWVYYVTNWQKRFNEGGRAKLVRLSPRHFVRYNDLKAKGRSQKTIALLLFKRVPAKAVASTPATRREERSSTRVEKVSTRVDKAREDKGSSTRTVTVEIDMLTHEQLLSLLQRALSERLPGLRSLPLTELRRLYLAVLSLGREPKTKG